MTLIFQRPACGSAGLNLDISGFGGRSWRGRFGVVLALAMVLASGMVCAAAGAAGACPNEALRQELHPGALPDCRAYEMVTPAYAAGGGYAESGFGGIPPLSVSADGTRLIVPATGGFANTQSDTFQNTQYEYSRSASGWDVTAISPPASMSPESVYLGSSRDLTRTLWNMHSADQSIYENYLYVREQDGHFVEIGPLQPSSVGSGPPSGTSDSFARGDGSAKYEAEGGASADLSHIVFAVNGGSAGAALWPGDTTLLQNGINSLYEYSAPSSTTPELVGVNANGENITQCGTQLGGEDEKYNAISATGQIVFFTAKSKGCQGTEREGKSVSASESKGPLVSELYARLNGSETVKLSEPPASQCGACRTGSSQATTTERSAQFAGASEDGSKAFFMTSQELLAGQTTTNLYEYDFDNPESQNATTGKIVLASLGSAKPEVQGVARVSQDGSHVYFVARGVLSGENSEHNSPVLGADNLYVFERDAAYPGGRVAFIAQLCSGAGESGTVADAQCHGSDAADWRGLDQRPVQATPDGRFAVFTSSGDLTPDDTSTVNQVFEYDAQEERLVRVSVGFVDDGNTETAPAIIPSQNFVGVDPPSEALSQLALSDDGAYVFFMSAAELTEGAKTASEAGAPSVYEYHSSGSIANGNVHLISEGTDTTRSFSEFGIGVQFLATDTSGEDAFFQTGGALLPRDTNSGRDIYDARIDGGFPEPTEPSSCNGEACQGKSSSSLVSSRSPGSVSALAGGNLAGPTTERSLVPAESRGLPPSTKRLSRAQRLAKALNACRRLSRRKRARCEAQARKRYGVKSTRRGK